MPRGQFFEVLTLPTSLAFSSLRQIAGCLLPLFLCLTACGPGHAKDAETPSYTTGFSDEVYQRLVMSREAHWDLRADRLASICGGQETAIFCGHVDPDRTNILVIGDSFGQDAVNMMAAGFPDVNLLVEVQGGCPLLRDLSGAGYSNEDCPDMLPGRFAAIEKVLPDVDGVLISIKITEERLPGLKTTIDWMSEHNVQPVVLGVGPWIGRRDLPELILEYGKPEGLDAAIQNQFIKKDFWIDDDFETYVTERGGKYVRKLAYFCPEVELCHAMTDNGWSFTADRTHLTVGAAEAFGRYMAATYPGLFEPRDMPAAN